MRIALLNECELCGRRWCPPAVTPETVRVAAQIVEAANDPRMPAGCPHCNPRVWGAVEQLAGEKMPDAEFRQQRLRGEGWLRLEGNRARLRDDIPLDAAEHA